MRPPLIMQRLQRNPAALGLSVSAIFLIGLLLQGVILDRLIETTLDQLFK